VGSPGSEQGVSAAPGTCRKCLFGTQRGLRRPADTASRPGGTAAGSMSARETVRRANLSGCRRPSLERSLRPEDHVRPSSRERDSPPWREGLSQPRQPRVSRAAVGGPLQQYFRDKRSATDGARRDGAVAGGAALTAEVYGSAAGEVGICCAARRRSTWRRWPWACGSGTKSSSILDSRRARARGSPSCPAT